MRARATGAPTDEVVTGTGRGSGEPFAPWSLPSRRVLDAMGVDPGRGLSSVEVRRRRARHGPNRLRELARRSAWKIAVDQFVSLIVALLAIAALVAFTFGEWIEGAAIAAVIVLNGAIGFATELRAVRSMEALRRLGRVAAVVRRDGQVQRVQADALVPGDVVLLEAGNVVSADLRLLQASKLQVDESTLTGESLPVDKLDEVLPVETPLAERRNLLFKGTSVTRGSAEAVVVATGMSTELGRISALVEQAEPRTTPLEMRLAALGRRLVGVTLGIAALVALTGLLGGRDPLLVVEISIALAVATVPEGLPIVATVALARGMWRMARRHALVEQLAAVETLGSTGVILTDKTGTLTENRMALAEVALAGETLEIEAAARHPGVLAALRVGALCSNASLADDAEAASAEGAVGDPMEVALLVAAERAGLGARLLREREPELREVSFDPDLKMMATFHGGSGGIGVAVKGAPEAVLPLCTDVLDGAASRPLTADERADWVRRAHELAATGRRLIALAQREAGSPDEDPYRDLTLVGLASLLDPPRERVREALEACEAAHIRVVMVTGDHAATALTVAAAVGLIDASAAEAHPAIDGREVGSVDRLGREQRERLLAARIVARATPQQKLDLIALHQAAGHVVAMTGDGVNDAPALRKADIGIAMGRRGTQVAKEAADMVLQDDELSTIVAAIEQGRAIFANIRRFVVYLMSCNVSEILVVGLASLAQAPLPLLPMQILFLNLVTDVFPALALGVGRGEPGLMQRHPRPADEPILSRDHWKEIVAHGASITLAVLGGFALAIETLGMPAAEAVTVSFLTLALAQTWHVFNMRGASSHWLRNEVTTNPWMAAAIAVCLALVAAAVYLPGLSSLLSLSHPGWPGWALVLTLSLLPLAAGPAVRAWTRRAHDLADRRAPGPGRGTLPPAAGPG